MSGSLNSLNPKGALTLCNAFRDSEKFTFWLDVILLTFGPPARPLTPQGHALYYSSYTQVFPLLLDYKLIEGRITD